MELLRFSMFGPRLYTIPTGIRTPSLFYKTNLFEKMSNYYLDAVQHCITIAKWTLPLWFPFAFRIGDNVEWITFFMRSFFCMASLYLLMYIVRGLCRLKNSSYRKFAEIYLETEAKKTDSLIESLKRYGFSFHWPTQFDVRAIDQELLVTRNNAHQRPQGCKFLSAILWILARTVGVLIVYPGCISLFNSYMVKSRMVALDNLRVKFGAQRIGLRARDGEFVEAYYVDGRKTTRETNGKILVICFEGNGGFAETGVSSVPLSKGFSVVAYNHPGFGGSTALPFPKHETNAIEAVLLFAIHKLKFSLANIRLFGWSIGGFSVTWAAMHFPNVGGLILDATFDSLDILTKSYVPSVFAFLESIPVGVIRNHFNLNSASQIIHYNGPILIIRRDNDEVISTCSSSRRSTNRGNFLLIALLKYRYPHLFNKESEKSLEKFLALDASSQESYLSTHCINDDSILPILERELRKELTISDGDSENKEPTSTSFITFPLNLGRSGFSEDMRQILLLFLASKYFLEVKGSHRSPLDPEAFKEPWSELTFLNIPIL